MTKNDMIEKIAEIIYLHGGGMDPEEYEEMIGVPRRSWRIPGNSWDTNPNELCEWERDEYRLQAEKVVSFIEQMRLFR